ncbi:tyrosine-type recombinase/integrase [Streptomyces hilarionis]|uniref:tyrosine-type recombinase/integrase n=1 Tax=Streptomyces hilarionis TaxID=2839954 RepID=UPI00211A2EB5|nr:site-specific integrase [Streptomyces hilarionis]
MAEVWPATQGSIEDVVGRMESPPLREAVRHTQWCRVTGVRQILGWLQQFPGDSWQQRWNASPAAASGVEWGRMAAEWIAATSSGVTATIVGSGLVGLVLADVLRPSLSWQMARRARHMQDRFALVRDPEGFARLQTLAGPGRWASLTGRRAVNDLTKIMVAKGGTLADITVGDALEYRAALQEHHTQSAGHTLFYAWLRRLGSLPDDAPATLRNLSRATGQVGIEQLVDRYDLTCRPVRDLLVDYLTERRPGLDYATLDNLSRFLALHFWADLEAHHPGIDSLHLPPQVAAQWKQRAQTKTVRRRRSDGTYDEVTSPRLDGSTLLIAVRALYLDLAQWAGEEPTRWGPWVAPCPIREADLNVKKQGQRVKARMDQRTRQRLPALPTVVRAAKELLDNAQARLQAVQTAPAGGRFEVLGETFTRARKPGSTWVYDAGGRRRDLVQRERRAFWGWATVEFLQHTGARIEEMLEASHHSLIQYRLPTTGEVVPLLQIAPSKTDQERVLLVSPELADVLSTIITRIRDLRTGAVPQVAAYDYNERVWNPPMPLLFQYDRSGEISAINGEFLRKCLNDVLDATGLTDADGCPLDFDPHDFRRIFITDAIRSGLPPHIAQVIAGHSDINTTMGYNAIYPADAIEAHRAFIARRRSLRPSEEYRTPTNEEWDAFLSHFEKRKLSLGTCARAFGTACIHEHACVRCSLLRAEPSQRGRLLEIRDNLLDRIAEAQREGWHGEVDGLEISLAGAEQKLTQLDAALKPSVVHLGLPAFGQIAGQSNTL